MKEFGHQYPSLVRPKGKRGIEEVETEVSGCASATRLRKMNQNMINVLHTLTIGWLVVKYMLSSIRMSHHRIATLSVCGVG